MRLLVFFFLIFLLIAAVLLGIGTGIGFLLHWLLPPIDLGIGILIGVVTLAFAGQLFVRITSLPLLGDFDDEPEYDEPPTPARAVTIIPDPPRRRGRKRKPTDT